MRRLAYVLIALAVALCFIGYRTRRRRHDLEARLAAAEQWHVALLRSVAAAKARAASADRQLALARAMLREPHAAASSPKNTGPISLFALQANNPELANLWIANLTANLDQDYGVLCQILRLTPQQWMQLKTILQRKISALDDLGIAALAKGLKYGDPTVKALRKQIDDQANADEAALLGPAAYRQLEDYDRSLPARRMVAGLAGLVAFTDPLTAEQGNALTAAMADANANFRAGEPIDLLGLDWATVDDKAQAILSPIQYRAWREGDPRDVRGGWPRSMLELQKVYDDAVKADQDRASATGMPSAR